MNEQRIPSGRWPENDDASESADEAPYVEVGAPAQPFHIGQCYEDEVAKNLVCRACGSEQFNVAIGSHFTAIRCSQCLWERCVHEG